jgi:PAS domain S-box-containing protein
LPPLNEYSGRSRLDGTSKRAPLLTGLLKPMRWMNDLREGLPDWLRSYLFAFSQLTLGTTLAVLLMNAFGARATLGVSLIGDVAFLGCAWLGYGEGILAGILITFVIPRLLLPGTPLHPDAARFGLLLVLSLLVSSASRYKRNAERTLKLAADELESRVQLRTRELQASELRFRQLADSMPQIVWTATQDGQLEYLNQRWHEFTGIGLSDHLTEDIHSIIHPDSLAEFVASWESVVHTKQSYETEVRLLDRGTGGYRWFLCRGLLVDDSSGGVRWFGTFTDINQQKITQRKLHRVNDELLQFAYAAAHDMQEPLRNIILRLSIFRQERGNQFDPAAAKWVSESVVDAQRMHTMVKDLLAFSSALDGAEEVEGIVDATDSLREALANLGTNILEKQAEIRFDFLPSVRVQRFHLTQLFQNLVGNALKYGKQDVAPVVQICAESTGDEWVFSVIDNGIGFNPAYAERIFGVFKRLHHHGEYPGTGIGLAICARIVAHYGGRIWAEGEPGKGATFRFALPGQNSGTLQVWMPNQQVSSG